MRIKHPHFTPGRTVFLGVEFIDGFAEVDSLHPVVVQTLEQHGYQIVEDVAPSFVDLKSLTLAQLKEIAEVEGIDVPKNVKKAALIELLEQPAESGPDVLYVGGNAYELPEGTERVAAPFQALPEAVESAGEQSLIQIAETTEV